MRMWFHIIKSQKNKVSPIQRVFQTKLNMKSQIKFKYLCDEEMEEIKKLDNKKRYATFTKEFIENVVKSLHLNMMKYLLFEKILEYLY